MKGYKFTTSDNYTGIFHRPLKWGRNVTHEINGGKGDLCTGQWLHYYDTALLAVFMCPTHGISSEKLWNCEIEGEVYQTLTKSGCTKLTTIEEITIPQITTDQRVEIGIRCAMEVNQDPEYRRWAHKWLSGEDRSARAAARAAEAAARAAEAAARAAAWAARAAAEAAEAAEWAAARAAEWAKETDKNIDLQKIIEEVTK